MQYLLRCECGFQHIVREGTAGTRIKCPCEKTISVPSLRILRTLPPAQPKDSDHLLPRDEKIPDSPIDQIPDMSRNGMMESANSAKHGHCSPPVVPDPAANDSFDLQGEYIPFQHYGVDLVEHAAQGELNPVICRDREIRNVIEILSRRAKNNLVLVGEPGVGKKAIVDGLAMRILHKDVPNSLKNRRVVQLDIDSLVVDLRCCGDREDRVPALLQALVGSESHVILYVDEWERAIEVSESPHWSRILQIVKPALERGDLPCIGSTTPDNYQRMVEKHSSIARLFRPVSVGAPLMDDVIMMLRAVKARYEAHYNVRITDSALRAAAMSSRQGFSNRCLPGAAINLLDEAASRLDMELENVPWEIDDVQRRIRKLESVRIHLVDERVESARQKQAEVETEILTLKKLEAELRDQWEAEKLTLVCLPELRGDCERAEAEFQQLEAAIKQHTAAGESVGDHEFQHLYELDARRRQLADQITRAEKQNRSDMNQTRRARLLRMEVTEREIAEAVLVRTELPAAKTS